MKEPLDYLSIKQELQSKNQPHLYELASNGRDKSNGAGKNLDALKFSDYPKFSYEILTRAVEELPESIFTDSKEVKFNFVQ
jgi:hypothetical protein